jgi:O-antigen/teichoic acid export membrane protein
VNKPKAMAGGPLARFAAPARVIALLPPGTVAVGAGLAVLGAASYVHLAVASHTLSKAHYSALAVLWSIVFTVGLGLFLPIEQEVTRIVAGRRSAGEGIAPVYRRGALLALTILAVICVVLAFTAGPIANRLFGGDRSLIIAMVGGFAGLAVAHPTRGVLAGTRRFDGYGTQLGVDGGLRILCAAALGVFHVRSALLFGLILAVAPILSVLVTAPAVRAGLSAGRSLAWSALFRGLGPLTVSTLLAQVMVNIAVVNVKLLAPGAEALAGALLSALILVRIPLFVFASLQASLLPGLSTAAATKDRTAFRHLVLRGCGIVTATMIAGGIPAIAFGPWLIHVFFDAADVLDRLDFAILAAGTWAYLLAQVLGQGAMALGRHRDQALAWLGGTVALIIATVVPGEVKLRVEGGYALGSAVTAVLLAIVVVRLAGRPADTDSGFDAATSFAAMGGLD